MDPLLRKMHTYVEFGIKLMEMNGHLTRPPPNSLDSSYFLFIICHRHFFINPARRQEGRLLPDFTASESLLSSFISNSFMRPSLGPRQKADLLSSLQSLFFRAQCPHDTVLVSFCFILFLLPSSAHNEHLLIMPLNIMLKEMALQPPGEVFSVLPFSASYLQEIKGQRAAFGMNCVTLTHKFQVAPKQMRAELCLSWCFCGQLSRQMHHRERISNLSSVGQELFLHVYLPISTQPTVGTSEALTINNHCHHGRFSEEIKLGSELKSRLSSPCHPSTTAPVEGEKASLHEMRILFLLMTTCVSFTERYFIIDEGL